MSIELNRNPNFKDLTEDIDLKGKSLTDLMREAWDRLDNPVIIREKQALNRKFREVVLAGSVHYINGSELDQSIMDKINNKEGFMTSNQTHLVAKKAKPTRPKTFREAYKYRTYSRELFKELQESQAKIAELQHAIESNSENSKYAIKSKIERIEYLEKKCANQSENYSNLSDSHMIVRERLSVLEDKIGKLSQAVLDMGTNQVLSYGINGARQRFDSIIKELVGATTVSGGIPRQECGSVEMGQCDRPEKNPAW